LVQVGFHERRKMIRNVLIRQLGQSADAIDRALATCLIDGERRPQTLSVDEWISLRASLGVKATAQP
jgi:16S rRNA A1518/A1519 N6-dimethyltransferase RsmA/KsgA/DIM1 with predicted DNA glycosylase/AP lyase activity